MSGVNGGDVLGPAERSFIADARRATLATIDPGGLPRLVPICFVLEPDVAILWTPLDEKPKAVGDPRRLARVTDILERSAVSVLVDRWDEDWTRLAWVRCHGSASLVDPGGNVDQGGHGGHREAIVALRAKYAQYADHALESRPMVRIALDRVTSWGSLER